MKVLEYLYYRMYKYYDNGIDIMPSLSTFAVIFVFGYFNILSLFDLIFAVVIGLKYTYFVGTGMSFFWPLLGVVPLYLLFRHYMKTLGNHERIFDQFKDEDKVERRKNGVFVFLYFIGSIGLFIGVLWLRQELRGY